MATRTRVLRQSRSANETRPIGTKGSSNVFVDVGFGKEEAANLLIRSHLMTALDVLIEKRGLSQAQAAKLFGVTQPRVSDLMRGKIELFSIDTLVRMLARAGIRVDVRTSVRTP